MHISKQERGEIKTWNPQDQRSDGNYQEEEEDQAKYIDEEGNEQIDEEREYQRQHFVGPTAFDPRFEHKHFNTVEEATRQALADIQNKEGVNEVEKNLSREHARFYGLEPEKVKKEPAKETGLSDVDMNTLSEYKDNLREIGSNAQAAEQFQKIRELAAIPKEQYGTLTEYQKIKNKIASDAVAHKHFQQIRDTLRK